MILESWFPTNSNASQTIRTEAGVSIDDDDDDDAHYAFSILLK